MNAMTLPKIAWRFMFFGPDRALGRILPAARGLVICNAGLPAAWRESDAPKTSGPVAPR
jgi:hypothetical protein